MADALGMYVHHFRDRSYVHSIHMHMPPHATRLHSVQVLAPPPRLESARAKKKSGQTTVREVDKAVHEHGSGHDKGLRIGKSTQSNAAHCAISCPFRETIPARRDQYRDTSDKKTWGETRKKVRSDGALRADKAAHAQGHDLVQIMLKLRGSHLQQTNHIFGLRTQGLDLLI